MLLCKKMNRYQNGFNIAGVQAPTVMYTLWMLWALTGCSYKTRDISRPEDNRFTKVVLARNLDEPMQLELLKDGRVLFVERKGKIKLYDPTDGVVRVLADIPVRHQFFNGTHMEESEDGLQGILLDPGFDKNQLVYIYYAPLEGPHRYTLICVKWTGGAISLDSAHVLLEIPVDPDVCCHIGGGMAFDTEGNLLLATGENAQIGEFSTLDERPGQHNRDGQKSAANTNDLRGKILRIKPLPVGKYEIPKGNLFPPGMPKTRPEIYTMGNRNPWRLSVDSKTGWVYWGEVGPGGNRDLEGRGPRAHDEFNQARAAGNFGYPHFIANNKPYWRYDFATGVSGEKFNPELPLNLSPNNSGRDTLPPAVPAFIWYPYIVSEEFPELGSGGSSAVGGPIYRRSNFPHARRPFPAYYEGKWFITDWVRGWIMLVSFTPNGDYQSMERFLPQLSLNGAIDMDFGPDGDLYILEYGSNGTFKGNPDAMLIKLSYNAGNRQPVAKVTADKTGGPVPLTVQVSSSGSVDYDKDPLHFAWQVYAEGRDTLWYYEPEPLVTLDSPGVYTAMLTVSDPQGASDSASVEIVAGNTAPQLQLDMKQHNRSFYFQGTPINYAVRLTDAEDGTLVTGIDHKKVEMSIDFVSNVYTKEAIESVTPDPSIPFVMNMLMSNSDCKSCHQMNQQSLGPSFVRIAEKYRNDPLALQTLTQKTIEGGNGSWGDVMMPPHPLMPYNDAATIVRYILALDKDGNLRSQKLEGRFLPGTTQQSSHDGQYLLRAAYRDKGAPFTKSIEAVEWLLLKNPKLPVSRITESYGASFNRQITLDHSDYIMDSSGAWLLLRDIDLTGIKKISFRAAPFPATDSLPGKYIEVRIGSPDGQPIGKSDAVGAGGNGGVAEARITALSGTQDLYFVYRNDNKTNPAAKIKIWQIEFKVND